MSKQSDYEKGVKHGLNSSEGNDCMEALGHVILDLRSEAMRKGEEYGIEQRHKNESKAAAAAKSAQTSESSSGDYPSDYSDTTYGSSSGGYSSGDYSNDASTANPVTVFFKFIGVSIFIIILISMCDKGSNTQSTQTPRPATRELPQSAPKENTAPPQELIIKETKQHSSGESTLQRRNAGVDQQYMDRKEDPDYFDPSGL